MGSWLNKLLPPKIKRGDGVAKRSSLPEGLWRKCPACEAVLYATDLEKNLEVCPKCRYHNRIGARRRVDILLDPEERAEIGQEVVALDVLRFKDSRSYTDRLAEAQASTHELEALIVVQGAIHSLPVVLAVFEFEFMGGSMGGALGERFVRGVNAAIEMKCPFVCVTASGGARMQEGLFSLMQMAKTNAAISRLGSLNLPFISVLTDPTMGGVSASFAFLGDIVMAEPGALIGFAGPRVIEQTVRQTLPEGFQRAEFLLEKGALDMIVDRREMKTKLFSLLAMMMHVTPR